MAAGDERQPPQPLVGEIVDRREATTRRDSIETVLVVRSEDGAEWSLWLLGAVLQRELGTAQPGDRLAVRWLGMRPNAEGTPYRSYRVALEPRDGRKGVGLELGGRPGLRVRPATEGLFQPCPPAASHKTAPHTPAVGASSQVGRSRHGPRTRTRSHNPRASRVTSSDAGSADQRRDGPICCPGVRRSGLRTSACWRRSD